MIFFYEKPDGYVVDCTEEEAYTYQYAMGWKQLGSSDGKTFHAFVNPYKEKVAELMNEAASFRQNNLPVSKKLLTALTKADHELTLKLKEGLEKELEVARGHYTAPPNNNVIVVGANPEKVKNIMKARM